MIPNLIEFWTHTIWNGARCLRANSSKTRGKKKEIERKCMWQLEWKEWENKNTIFCRRHFDRVLFSFLVVVIVATTTQSPKNPNCWFRKICSQWNDCLDGFVVVVSCKRTYTQDSLALSVCLAKNRPRSLNGFPWVEISKLRKLNYDFTNRNVVVCRARCSLAAHKQNNELGEKEKFMSHTWTLRHVVHHTLSNSKCVPFGEMALQILCKFDEIGFRFWFSDDGMLLCSVRFSFSYWLLFFENLKWSIVKSLNLFFVRNVSEPIFD